MSSGGNNPGMSRFAAAMRSLAAKDTDNSLLIDFGSIRSDGSLLTNTCPVAIPKTDYVVCGRLAAKTVKASTSSKSVGDHGAHAHTVEIEAQQALKAGDRVLVAWVYNDPVVIDLIVQASSIL